MQLNYWNENWKAILQKALEGTDRKLRFPTKEETNLANEKLNKRGIENCISYGWKLVSLNGNLVWVYPIIQPHHELAMYQEQEPILRCKFVNPPDKIKNYWLKKNTYYVKNLFYHSLIENPEQVETICIMGGEPDFFTVEKYEYCLTPVNGEKFNLSYKQEIARFYSNLKRIICFPDCDLAGYTFAYNLYRTYQNSDIEIICLKLPFGFGDSFNDTNDFYQRNPQSFKDDYKNLDVLEIEEIREKLKLHKSEVLSDNEYMEWQEELILALGEPANSSGTGFWNCFNPQNHTHGDANPSLTFRLNDNSDAYNIFCPQCYPHYEKSGWDDLAIHLSLPTFEQYKNQKQSVKNFFDKKGGRIRLLSDVVDELILHYEGKIAIKHGRTITSPLADIHNWDGGCRTLTTGQTTMVVGGSGSHKTNLGMVIIGNLLNRGFSSVIWSPEWTAEGHIVRQMVRKGIIRKWEIEAWSEWVNWALKGRRGQEPYINHLGGEDNRKEKINRAIDFIRAYKSLPQSLAFLETAHGIEQIADDFKDAVIGMRHLGKDVFGFLFDYIQISTTGGDNYLAYENALHKIENVCRELDIWHLTTCQARKGESDAVVNDGHTLHKESGQGITSQKPKVILTLNPRYEENGSSLNYLDMACGKNNEGKEGYRLNHIGINNTGGLDYFIDENGLVRFSGSINTLINRNSTIDN